MRVSALFHDRVHGFTRMSERMQRAVASYSFVPRCPLFLDGVHRRLSRKRKGRRTGGTESFPCPLSQLCPISRRCWASPSATISRDWMFFIFFISSRATLGDARRGGSEIRPRLILLNERRIATGIERGGGGSVALLGRCT